MTYKILACPCCGNRELDSRVAIVAPFIAKYVLDRQPELCDLNCCLHCHVVFYATRYEDAEISRLYQDYRGERYFAMRHHFEPWYTRAFNESIGSSDGMASRQAVYRKMLASVEDTIGSVLDYAGDSGQMMVGGPGEDLSVFDISGVPPVPGVISIADEDALKDRQFDLVLLCGIVEHFSEPLIQVKRVGEYVKPGGLLYIEVPDEQFALDQIPRASWYSRYLGWLVGSRLPLLLADFWSTGFRVKFARIPPLGFVKLHEHQNYFDVTAMAALVQKAGFQLLECRAAECGSVVALCRRPAH